MWLTIGSFSTPLDEIKGDATHKWTCYIKVLESSHPDISSIIDKVIFKLHESFSNPLRVIQSPPFEINEVGWGEFEIQIRIVFKDLLLKPITLFHMLRLYPDSEASQKEVLAERIERITFETSSAISAMPPSLVDSEAAEYDRLKSILSEGSLLS